MHIHLAKPPEINSIKRTGRPELADALSIKQYRTRRRISLLRRKLWYFDSRSRKQEGKWQQPAKVEISIVPSPPGLRIERGGGPLLIEVGLPSGEKLFYRDQDQFPTKTFRPWHDWPAKTHIPV